MSQKSMELDLAPHEQLDEIDCRTNDDGTVEVKILKWSKVDGDDIVSVMFRTPTGKVETEVMTWPQANNEEYKFIRFINETPYTLRTADQINGDGDVWVTANPGDWKLNLPEKKNLSQKFPDINETGFKLFKLVFWPITIIGVFLNLVEYDTTLTPRRGSVYDEIYLRDGNHRHESIGVLKSTFVWALWLWAVYLLILML